MASLPKGLASFENPPKSPARKPPASKLILHDRISMKSALPLLAVALSGCTSSVSHETVQQHITNQAHQIEAHAPAASRMIAVADFDDDGIADTAVVYTLESAHHDNSHQQFLAVSSSRLGGRFFDVVAGGKDDRAIVGVRIAALQVELAILEYVPTDATCCPSRSAITEYILKDGALVEVIVN